MSPRTAHEGTRLRITVLRGGPSAEREVSLASGRAVAEALRRRGHDVFEADIGPDNLAALDHPADVVFPVLHGTFGEDGQVQRLMEQRGLRFVGSGSRASALAMDKVAAKELVRRLGFDTPPAEVFAGTRVEAGASAEFPVRFVDPVGGEWQTGLEPPAVVKPADQGSSVSTYLVHEPGEFEERVREVVRAFGRALVERFIAGDELTVGIVGRETLPPVCVRPRRSFYDFEAKYHDDATEYLFETGHSPELLARVQEQSMAIFTAMGCRHLARVDWIADADGHLWFLEVNTIPGFTSHSLVPKAAAHVGVPFDELVDRLVRMALEG